MNQEQPKFQYARKINAGGLEVIPLEMRKQVPLLIRILIIAEKTCGSGLQPRCFGDVKHGGKASGLKTPTHILEGPTLFGPSYFLFHRLHFNGADLVFRNLGYRI